MISPFIFVTIALVGTIINRLYTKYLLFKLDSFAVAILTNLFGLVLMFIFAVGELSSVYSLNSEQIVLILLAGVLWTFVSWVGNLSIAQNNFSFKEIIRQTRMIWVVLAGIFILGEEIAVKDILGIILIISSVYIISYKTLSFKEHISSGPVLLAWAVAFVAAGIAILEKIILTIYSTPVGLYAFLMYLLPTIFLIMFLNKDKVRVSKEVLTNNYGKIFLSSLIMVIYYYASLMAYKLLPIAISYPLIQSSTVIGVLIGTFLFEDGKDWKKKTFAAIIAVTGILIIKFL